MATDAIVCHCCGEPPELRLDEPGRAHLSWRCACMGDTERVRHQRQELAKLNATLARKNLQLDALHFVWCSGACEGGTHRHGGELTREIVEEAERNTRRLRARWDALERKTSDALDAAEDREAVAQRELGEAIRADMAAEREKLDFLNEPLTPEEFAARFAEVRPDLEAAMWQGIAEADAARKEMDRSWGETWKKLEGMRFK